LGGYPIDPRFEWIDLAFDERRVEEYSILAVRSDHISGLPNTLTRFNSFFLLKVAEVLGTNIESVRAIITGIFTAHLYKMPGYDHHFLWTKVRIWDEVGGALWNLNEALRAKYKEVRVLRWAEENNVSEILRVLAKPAVDAALALGAWIIVTESMRPRNWKLTPEEKSQYEEVVEFFEEEDNHGWRIEIEVADCTFPNSTPRQVRITTRVLTRVAACLVIPQEQLLNVLAGRRYLEIRHSKASWRVVVKDLPLMSPRSQQSVQVEFEKVQRRVVGDI
jgi:hypothetical protein